MDTKVYNGEVIETFEKGEAYKLLIPLVQKELQNLERAYQCKNLQELAHTHGKYDGLIFILNLIETYKQQGKMTQEQNILNEIKQKSKDNAEEPKEL